MLDVLCNIENTNPIARIYKYDAADKNKGVSAIHFAVNIRDIYILTNLWWRIIYNNSENVQETYPNIGIDRFIIQLPIMEKYFLYQLKNKHQKL